MYMSFKLSLKILVHVMYLFYEDGGTGTHTHTPPYLKDEMM